MTTLRDRIGIDAGSRRLEDALAGAGVDWDADALTAREFFAPLT